MENVYDLLDKIENARTEKEALKYAKEAYKLYPNNFDVVLALVQLEDNPLKRWEILEKGLKKEKTRLKKLDYFDDENIGIFYGMLDTRPYIRGLCLQVDYLIYDGKYKQAIDLCNEILRLNVSDNTGTRYILMALYAILEEEEPMLELFKKYKEECLEMLFPLFTLYYKQSNDKKAKEYLNRINEVNPYFLKFFKGKIKNTNQFSTNYYSKGDVSEVFMYLEIYSFLLRTIPNIDSYILDKCEN